MQKEGGTSSLRKAIGVLKCFSEDRRELSMTEMAQMLRLPLGTASRILNALAEENLLVRDERTRLYQLGVECLRMGKIAKLSGSLRTCALPFMKNLRNRFNETVNMYVREGHMRVCYAQCETASPLKRSIPLGARFPLGAGAAGRCLLAWAPKEFVLEVIAELRPFTENTVMDKEKIWALLERTKRERYSLSFAEREKGVAAVAVPLFDAQDSVCASLSIAGPDIRFMKETVEEMIVALKETSVKLSAILSGGRGQKMGYEADTPAKSAFEAEKIKTAGKM
ncbi:MAG: IclR family transcriptional regulator [Synergistaceae bacterium]|jgi:DNA-binding IclR family transcriptional regulator|nr:IclR family transcriptional regulator [Synergistaceae bacterium]